MIPQGFERFRRPALLPECLYLATCISELHHVECGVVLSHNPDETDLRQVDLMLGIADGEFQELDHVALLRLGE
jgi:hypothetical protein